MARVIQSPGVQINEIDFSLRPSTVEGTGVFLAGFSNQGPLDEVLQPGSVSEFERIYGEPTNSAERYFYQTAKAILQSPARLITTRLPYGEDRGEGFDTWRYSALVYPAKSIQTTYGEYNILTDFIVENTGNYYPLNPDDPITVNITPAEGDIISVPATATAVLSSLGCLSIVLIDEDEPGQGLDPAGVLTLYATSTPDVSSSWQELDATLTVNPSGGLSGIQFNSDEGRGVFTTVPTLSVVSEDQLESEYTQPVFDVSLGYKIENVFIDTVGIGYTNPPTIKIEGGNPGVGAQISPVLLPQGGNLSVDVTRAMGLTGANTYLFGKPTHVELSVDEYTELANGNIDWSNFPEVNNKDTAFTYETLKDAGLIILNKSQTAVNNSFEGYYVGILDNNNYNPATPFNGVLSVEGVQHSADSVNNYVRVPESRLNFTLSASKFGDGFSVSEVMENLSPNDLNSRSFDDTITIGLFKLRKSIFTPDTNGLDYVLAESFVGSLDYHRQIADQTGGPAKTYFIEEIADKSSNIRVMVNPYISNRFSETWLNDEGVPTKKVRFASDQLATPFDSPGFKDVTTGVDDTYTPRVGATQSFIDFGVTTLGSTDALFPVGVYTSTTTSEKAIGHLPGKLERAFELVENVDIYQINLACEGGLGTIYVNALEQSGTAEEIASAGPFVDSKPLNSLSALYTTSFDELNPVGLTLRSRYTSIANVFVNAAEKQRKDFMVILDPLRNIFVQGFNTKIINTKNLYGPNGSADGQPGRSPTNFSQHIYWPLRHLFGTINSSFATTYANWVQVVESTSNRQVWVPFSGFAAATMANVDANYQPWIAPAGFTRGVVVGANDLGVYPKQKQRDQLYKISINPIAFFPAEGFVIFGQKTLLKRPSAFDRINVRRLFLNLEVATRDTSKYFVFEPNTFFTRTRVVNTLAPIFENAKNTEGLYDYLIVCDERNNTPDVIDNNELKVDIYIKPVRTAEFILVSFYATRTGQDFQEIIGR